MAKIVVGLSVIWSDGDDALVLDHGIGRSLLREISSGKIEMRVGISRFDDGGVAVMGCRLINVPLLEKNVAEI
jgi:hypothetical protein